MTRIKPFVKWAGGKSQLLKEIKEFLPENINCYYEPFVGGGAIFFDLEPKKAVINDYNYELINVYRVMKDKDKYIKMCKKLKEYEKQHNEDFYYKLRSMDRKKGLLNRMLDSTRAARTIYLNKACFNGLYRVNSNNQFNVPFNRKEKINTFDPINLERIHQFLINSDIKIINGDFEKAVETAEKGDFVYFDPPYDAITNSFNYTDDKFGRAEQERLFATYKRLDEKGVKVMLSNHNTEYINNLYKDYKKIVINAKRNINSKGDQRGPVEETIIINF